MISHRSRSATAVDVDSRGVAPQRAANELRLPVDLLARQERCGQAGVGYVCPSGWIYDAGHHPLGHVDEHGIVRRGPREVATIEQGAVLRSSGGQRGLPFGSVRTFERPEYDAAYLCSADGVVKAFMLVDRSVCRLERARLIQLAGAALFLLSDALDRS
jgi:hypothetical protein